MSSKIKIGWLGWHPGLHGDNKTSAGSISWIKAIEDRWHDKYDLRFSDNILGLPQAFAGLPPSKMNAIIVIWRWPMHEYPDRHALYHMQMEVLKEAAAAKVPIIVHDEDLRITPKDMEYLNSIGAIVTLPAIFPPAGFRTLHYPDPFVKKIDLKRKMPFLYNDELVYIGNVYGRYEMAKEFLGALSKTHRVSVYGNWLEPGPDRPGATTVVAEMPHVHFHGRLSERMVVETLSTTSTTIHLHREEYGPIGFITFRWAEASAAAAMAFIPSGFRLTTSGFMWNLAPISVDHGNHLVELFDDLTERKWRLQVEMQRQFVEETMRLDAWDHILEEALNA